MKKALALILILLVITIPAFADTIDVSSMTTDDLIELKNSIFNELKNRIGELDHAHIVDGEYLVGTDIDAGAYELFRNEDYEDSSSVWIYASVEDMSAGTHRFSYRLYAMDEAVRIDLADGEYLKVSGSNGVDIRKAEKIIVP